MMANEPEYENAIAAALIENEIQAVFENTTIVEDNFLKYMTSLAVLEGAPL